MRLKKVTEERRRNILLLFLNENINLYNKVVYNNIKAFIYIYEQSMIQFTSTIFFTHNTITLKEWNDKEAHKQLLAFKVRARPNEENITS